MVLVETAGGDSAPSTLPASLCRLSYVPVWLMWCRQRLGVEPIQPVTTVFQTAPLADGVSLCMVWNLVDPAGFEPACIPQLVAERDSVRTASCSSSVVQSR